MVVGTVSCCFGVTAAAEGVAANLTIESQQIIDDAAATINNAIAGLKEKADYTTLNAAKSAAAKVDCETGNYTEESLTVFNTALANANALSDDLSVDEQQTVNDAATALNDAIAALKIKADDNNIKLKFTDTETQLYRLGNSDAIAMSSLYEATGDVDSTKFTVTVENLAGNAAGAFTANTTDWSKGTVKFTGTGVVKITEYCGTSEKLSFNAEIVDGYNVTSYGALKNRNSVLLNDIKMSSGSCFYLSGNSTIYGNGFTFDVKDGLIKGGNITANYLITLDSAKLNNVVIVGAPYIGHRFMKHNSNGSYDIVTMTDAYVTTEVTGAYSLSSAGTSNAIAEGLLTVAPPEDFYNWIEMDGKLHCDVEQFNADVEKYGLYDYEVFSDYVTYEQFVAFNGAYLKVPVEKGLFTFDYIIELINLYSQWMPE